MSERWLNDNETVAWRTYIETAGDLSTALEKDLMCHGLTLGDYQVLVYLSESGDHAMRMCDLADSLQLSPSGLTRRLDGLVASGYVTRRPSEVDRRVMMAVLTDAGYDLLASTAPHHVRSVRRHLLDPLDQQQICVLADIFESSADGLRPETGCGDDTEAV